MDTIALLDTARRAGLSVRADGDKLVVRGPKSAEALALALLDCKAEVLALLYDEKVVWLVTMLDAAAIAGLTWHRYRAVRGGDALYEGGSHEPR